MKNIFKLVTYIFKHRSILVLLFISLFLVSCSSGNDENNTSPFPENIDSIGDFFSLWLRLQISIFIFGLFLRLIFGQLALTISIVLHLIWVIVDRDYGFLMVTLLFFLNTIVTFLFKIISTIKEK